MDHAPDIIDRILGIAPGSALASVRGERAEIMRRSQTSHDAALRPRDPAGLGYGERAALAARMARIWGDPGLAAHYQALLAAEPDAAALAPLVDPASAPASPARLRAVVRHVDLISRTPEAATQQDIEALRAAGLPDRDIVSLAGLIAFVNYQIRVIAGFRLLQEA